MEARKGLGIAWLEGSNGLVGVRMAVVDVRAGAHIAEVRLVVRREHSGVNRRGKIVALRPVAGGMSCGFASLTDTDGFQLP
jgi:hypothetical protein